MTRAAKYVKLLENIPQRLF